MLNRSMKIIQPVVESICNAQWRFFEKIYFVEYVVYCGVFANGVGYVDGTPVVAALLGVWLSVAYRICKLLHAR